MGLFGGKDKAEKLMKKGLEYYEKGEYYKALHSFLKISGKLEGKADYWIAKCYMDFCESTGRESNDRYENARVYLRMSAADGCEDAARMLAERFGEDELLNKLFGVPAGPEQKETEAVPEKEQEVPEEKGTEAASERGQEVSEERETEAVDEKLPECIETEEKTGEEKTREETREEMGETAKEWFLQGREAFIDGDYKTAVVLIRKAAEKDFVPARMFLGAYYCNVAPEEERNLEEARFWCESEARSGDAAAEYLMANICEAEGKGEECMSWLKRSVEHGDIEAQFLLGTQYMTGNFVKKDLQAAKYWLELADKNGCENAKGCLSILEEMLEEEEERKRQEERQKGTEAERLVVMGKQLHQAEDYEKAFSCFKSAAEKGNAEGQMLLALCYRDAIGTRGNKKNYFSWLKKAAEQGLVGAQGLLGVCYAQGTGVKASLNMAQKWLTEAANQGDKKAKDALRIVIQNKAADSYNSGIGKIKRKADFRHFGAQVEDISEALPELKKAAEMGLPEAQVILASHYLYGVHYAIQNLTGSLGMWDQKNVDVEKGIYWLKKAVENEDPNATFVYAKYLFFGRLSTADDVLFETGVIPPDGVKEKEEALRYAKKAAELGCAAAEAWIQKVHE